MPSRIPWPAIASSVRTSASASPGVGPLACCRTPAVSAAMCRNLPSAPNPPYSASTSRTISVGQPVGRRQVWLHRQRNGARPLTPGDGHGLGAVVERVAAGLVGARHLVEHGQKAIGGQIRRPGQHLARRRQQDGGRPAIEVVAVVDVGPAVGVHADRHQVVGNQRRDAAVAVADRVHHRAPVAPGRGDRQQHGLAFGVGPPEGVGAPLQPGDGGRCRRSSCAQPNHYNKRHDRAAVRVCGRPRDLGGRPHHHRQRRGAVGLRGARGRGRCEHAVGGRHAGGRGAATVPRRGVCRRRRYCCPR